MDVIWLIFLLALGACVGSFLNVVIYRLPRGQSIVFPGSHCPSCGRAIRWQDNVPLISWLALRGRCRFCKVRISPRYLVIEAFTALLVGGLYAWYYLTDLRSGVGTFAQTWPAYTAHAVLLCGLLACSAVDVEKWIVPLEVCWFVSLVGVVALTASPPAVGLLPRISPTTGAMGLAALVGLVVALLLLRWGVIQRSFLDADDKPVTEHAKPQAANKQAPPQRKKKGKGRKGKKASRAARPAAKAKPPPKITAVAATKAHGVNPRREVLREVVFLAPAILLAIGAWLLLKEVPGVGAAWRRLHSTAEMGRWARHLGALEATVFGYLIGGLWIWGIRILGTLGFGKEAMGLGDVHILAAVGACCGWVVPSVAFFLAPIFGLLWAIYLWAGRKQRELPYGPWLAVATLVVMLFHDPIMKFLEPYRRVLG